MYICIAKTQTTSTETQSSATAPTDTETIADLPSTSSSVQIESNIGDNVGTEQSVQTEFNVVETMDVVDDILTDSPSSMHIDPGTAECAGGIDTKESSPIESIGAEVSIDDGEWPKFDLGNWVVNSSKLSDEQKRQILKHRWVPPENYNFREESDDPKRSFIHSWLHVYAPWLTYSKKLKGGLCLYCVLFAPITVHGVLGALIKTPYTKYKDMHESCKKHAMSQWHRASITSAKLFMEDVPVNIQMISGHEKMIEQNKKIISHIISTIIFCGTHDLALRGKSKGSGNFS